MVKTSKKFLVSMILATVILGCAEFSDESIHEREREEIIFESINKLIPMGDINVTYVDHNTAPKINIKNNWATPFTLGDVKINFDFSQVYDITDTNMHAPPDRVEASGFNLIENSRKIVLPGKTVAFKLKEFAHASEGNRFKVSDFILRNLYLTVQTVYGKDAFVKRTIVYTCSHHENGKKEFLLVNPTLYQTIEKKEQIEKNK